MPRIFVSKKAEGSHYYQSRIASSVIGVVFS
jgi:hypothetical protein